MVTIGISAQGHQTILIHPWLERMERGRKIYKEKQKVIQRKQGRKKKNLWMRSNEGIDFIKNICCAKQNFQLHPLPSNILKRRRENLGNVMLISHIISQMLFMNYASFSFLQCQTRVLILGKLNSYVFIIWMALGQSSTPWWCIKIYWIVHKIRNRKPQFPRVFGFLNCLQCWNRNLCHTLFIVSKLSNLLV